MSRKRVTLNASWFQLCANAYGIGYYAEWFINSNVVKIKNKATGCFHPFVDGRMEVVVRERGVIDKLPKIKKKK